MVSLCNKSDKDTCVSYEEYIIKRNLFLLRRKKLTFLSCVPFKKSWRIEVLDMLSNKVRLQRRQVLQIDKLQQCLIGETGFHRYICHSKHNFGNDHNVTMTSGKRILLKVTSNIVVR